MNPCNLLIVFDPSEKQVLMCRRRKPPYQGMLNFAGGKIEPGEDHLAAAYRELLEETSITREDIALKPLMVLSYPTEEIEMEVYAGVLNRAVQVSGSENDLLWVPVDSDFTDVGRFAGCGNIYHMMNYLRINRDRMLCEQP